MNGDAKPTLTITRGIPGSGKTSVATHFRDAGDVYVSRDSFRQMMTGVEHGKLDRDLEGLITPLVEQAVRSALKAGRDVVYDAMNLRNREALKWKRVAEEEQATFAVIDRTGVPLSTCLQDNQMRDSPVPEDVIIDLYTRYNLAAGPLGDPVDHGVQGVSSRWTIYVPDEKLSQAYIFDIDGTLAHMDGKRGPYEYDKVAGDRVDEVVLRVLRDLESAGNYIILVSGREDSCRSATVAWLDANGVPFDSLFMRATGDGRPDDVVKHEIFHERIANLFRVLGVFDDRDKVVDMWRAIGLKCFQVQPGPF